MNHHAELFQYSSNDSMAVITISVSTPEFSRCPEFGAVIDSCDISVIVGSRRSANRILI